MEKSSIRLGARKEIHRSNWSSRIPAIAGPINWPALKIVLKRAIPLGSWAKGITFGIMADRAGIMREKDNPLTSDRANTCHRTIWSVTSKAANTRRDVTLSSSPSMSMYFLSNESAITPAIGEKNIIGIIETACIAATRKVLSVICKTSQPLAMITMKNVVIEMSDASHSVRNAE